MPNTLNTLDNIAGGGGGPIAFTLNFDTSGTFTAPFACTVNLLVQAAGGSGAANAVALGGNSGPWGLKQISMAQGDVLAITIPAAALGVTGSVNGNPGGTTTVTLNGSNILTATGGEGGVGSGSAAITNPATIVSTITGADVWYPGLQAGAVTAAVSGARTGGAAVNVTGNGRGRSASLSVGSTVSAGGSVGNTPVANTTTAVEPVPTTNVLTFGIYPATGVGKGGDGNSAGNATAGGLFAGGGASGNTGIGGAGGYGAGGGASGSTGPSGAGGGAYVSLRITKDQ